MKNHQWTALSLIALIFASCQATGPTWNEVVDVIPSLANDKGRVFFYRERALEAASSQPYIYMNEKRVGVSQSGGFFWVDDDPGPKEVVAAEWTDQKLSFVLTARATMYVKTTPVQGPLIVQIAPQIVTAGTGAKEIIECRYTGEAISPKTDQD